MTWSLAALVLVVMTSPSSLYMVAERESVPLFTVSDPNVISIDHSDLAYTHVGQLLAIITYVTNGEVYEKQFTVIIETRDKTGITVDLQTQNGTVNAESQVEVAVLWRPQEAGEYEFRTFAISNFEDARILTEVRNLQWSVSDLT